MHRALILGLVPLVISCGEVGTGNVARDTLLAWSHDSFAVQRLSSEIIPLDPVVSQPFGLAVAGVHLLMVDRDGPPFVHLIDRETGNVVATGGGQGEGPGEFVMAPAIIGADPVDHDVVWLFDSMRQRLVALRLSSDSGRQRLVMEREVLLEALGVSFPVWAASDHLIARRQDWQAITMALAKIERESGRVSNLSSVALDDERFTGEDLLSVFDFRLCVRPGGERIAAVFPYQGRGWIAAANGDSLGTIAVPFPSQATALRHPVLPRLSFANGEGDVRRHYLQCVGTSSRILALYSGLLNKATPRGSLWPTAYVHAFDWGGHLMEVLELDHGTWGMAVDEQGEWLYTATMGPEGVTPVLRRTELPRPEAP